MKSQKHVTNSGLLAILIAVMSVTSACRFQAKNNGQEMDTAMDHAPPAARLPAAAWEGYVNTALPGEPMLVCRDNIGIQFFRFDTINQAWSQHRADLISDPKFAIRGLFSLQDDASLLVYGDKMNADGASQFHVYLWQDGREKLVLADENRYTILPHLGDLSSSQSYLYTNKEDDPFAMFRLDAARCKTGACEFSPVSELSLNSPLGTQVLIWNLQTWTIQIKDGVGENGEEIDTGGGPFWLDENRVGYLRPIDQPPYLGGMQSELVMRQVRNETEPTILLDPEMAKSLLVTVGSGGNLGDIILTNARGLANYPDIVLVSAAHPDTPDRAILFAINLQTNQLRSCQG